MKKKYNHKPEIKCLECGKKFVRPASHVWQVHGLSAREYKKLHGLDLKRGIATEEYRETMREHSKRNYSKVIYNNLIVKGASSRFESGNVPNYERSEQTKNRLKEHFIKNVLKKGDEHWKRQRAEWVTIPCEVCGKKKEYTRAYIEGRQIKHFYCSCRCATIGKNRSKGTSKL